MFGRYAIAFGRGEHRRALAQIAARRGFAAHIETPQLLLVGSAAEAFLHDGHSILVGQAFDATGARLAALPADLSRLEQCDDPQSALSGIWGNFALFNAGGNRALAYREPSGSVPVYRCGGEHQTIFASDAETASQLGLIGDPQIDSRFVAHWLQFPFLRTARTGLTNATELLPGMCVIQDRSGRWIEAPLWHPSRFATRDRLIRDGSEAARLLREAALRAVAAQPHGEKIVLRLSGGLDSSIIASCLSAAGLEFSCINFATRARDGDEREHARAVAQSLGLDLVEVTEGEPARLEAPSRRSFRPLLNPLLEPFERAVCETALALGADLLIDGAGGDNLFCSITSAAPLLDAIFSGNIGQAGRAANDIAMRANCTIWDVLLSAGRRLSRRGTQWKEDRSFLDARALLRTCDPHPWLQGLAVPPGKREHVEALVHIQHFLDRTQSSIPLLHPLLAQPLLELCLQVPSWLWVRGGRDRAIARDAFDGLVPASILRRRMKGSLQSLLYRSFSELRAEMRGLLLEGELASLGVVDTAAITDALGSEQWMADEVQLRISEMTALELWLRSWRADGASFSIAA